MASLFSTYPLPSYGFHSVYQKFDAILLEQTRMCCNNCVFCGFAKEGHQTVSMSMDDLAYVLGLFPDFSGDVGFSSGEVFTLKDLPKRIAMVKKAWPHCKLNITTTFNLWRGPEYIRDIFSAGIDSMYISCYAYTEEDYARVHGAAHYDGLCKNLEELAKLPKEMTDKVHLRYMPDTQRLLNIHAPEEKLQRFLDFIHKVGIHKLDCRNAFPFDTVKPVDGTHDWELSVPCSVVWGNKARELVVSYNLDVAPCCMFRGELVFGNLRTMSLEQIFNSEQYKFFYQAWWEMRPGDIPKCNNCQQYDPWCDTPDLYRMAAWQAKKLRGQKVIFWGGGEAYRAYKSFFVETKPIAMLLDVPERPTEVDGIPVYHPDDFLPTCGEPLPVVIFAMQRASPKIWQALKEKYAFYKPSQVVICPANAHINAPVEPFFRD